MNWIDIKELPPRDVVVLITDGNTTYAGKLNNDKRYPLFNFIENDFDRDISNYEDEYCYNTFKDGVITHWMCMPKYNFDIVK